MALSSTSTVTDALAQFNDNLQWRGNSAKALLALEAVEFLLVNRAQSASELSTRLDFAELEKLRGELRQYVEQITTGDRVYWGRARALTP